ncbi:hypothetical protein GGX14DRAFT_397418 [Mycena pura]|uniref:Uncharacterized protein n=1 Tax=Mycena pura TaxID=153505 RepID=A0AAD6VCE1_9AGAR|nr:hypothetical protein GGX14DRAFT_397418 [Mycena pura]
MLQPRNSTSGNRTEVEGSCAQAIDRKFKIRECAGASHSAESGDDPVVSAHQLQRLVCKRVTVSGKRGQPSSERSLSADDGAQVRGGVTVSGKGGCGSDRSHPADKGAQCAGASQSAERGNIPATTARKCAGASQSAEGGDGPVRASAQGVTVSGTRGRPSSERSPAADGGAQARRASQSAKNGDGPVVSAHQLQTTAHERAERRSAESGDGPVGVTVSGKRGRPSSERSPTADDGVRGVTVSGKRKTGTALSAHWLQTTRECPGCHSQQNTGMHKSALTSCRQRRASVQGHHSQREIGQPSSEHSPTADDGARVCRGVTVSLATRGRPSKRSLSADYGARASKSAESGDSPLTSHKCAGASQSTESGDGPVSGESGDGQVVSAHILQTTARQCAGVTVTRKRGLSGSEHSPAADDGTRVRRASQSAESWDGPVASAHQLQTRARKCPGPSHWASVSRNRGRGGGSERSHPADNGTQVCQGVKFRGERGQPISERSPSADDGARMRRTSQSTESGDAVSAETGNDPVVSAHRLQTVGGGQWKYIVRRLTV